MKIKITLCTLLILFGANMHGMVATAATELVQLAASPEGKAIGVAAMQFATSPTGQKVIQGVENFAEKEASSLLSPQTTTTATTTTTTTTPTVPTITVSGIAVASPMASPQLLSLSNSRDDIKEIPLSNGKQPKNNSMHLNLDNSNLAPKRAASASLPPKTAVRNTEQLVDGVNKVQKSSRATTLSSSNSDVVVNMISHDVVPNGVPTRRVRNYSEEEVWDFLRMTNPVLYRFAQDKGLSLDQTMLLGELKNKLAIEPEAVIAVVNKKNLADGKQSVVHPDEYKKLRQNDPDKYKEIVLEILNDVADELDGDKASSPLTDTHINILNDKVVETQKTNRNLWIAIVVKATLLVVGAGMTVWAAVNQASKDATSAPTMAPTFAPTFAPV